MYPADEQALGLAVEYAIGSGVFGDVVEFGCLSGRTAQILAREMARVSKSFGSRSDSMHKIPERNLWLFDSFEGFPETSTQIDADSPHIQARVWHAGEPRGGRPEDVHRRCAAYIGDQRTKVIKGWYKDTLLQLPAGQKFAVVHVDCDYYSSTYEVLNHLFRNAMISDGCIMLFDDWLCNRGSPKYGQQKAWSDLWSLDWPYLSFTNLGRYGVASWQFIVHYDKEGWGDLTPEERILVLR
jgi:hypothetical protein